VSRNALIAKTDRLLPVTENTTIFLFTSRRRLLHLFCTDFEFVTVQSEFVKERRDLRKKFCGLRR
jgi:hypothetical protein